jgi:SAM-dependent methyltransferase
MLMLSPREPALGRVNADAHQLPFISGSFALVAAFLFDPFNERHLFTEVARVLKADGLFVGSLPHSTWGTTLRLVKGVPPAEATFVLRDGQPYSRPSFLSTEEDLTRNLVGAGFLVRTMLALRLPRAVADISPDVEVPARALGLSVYDLPLVQLFVAARS